MITDLAGMTASSFRTVYSCHVDEALTLSPALNFCEFAATTSSMANARTASPCLMGGAYSRLYSLHVSHHPAFA